MRAINTGRRLFVYMLACLSAVGPLLFGYDVGIMSASMIFIRKEFDLNRTWQQTIVSSTVAAAAVFSLFAGYTNDVIGRRKTVLLASAVYTVGAAVMGASLNQYMLMAGRIGVGAAVGFLAVTCPLYVAECSPPDIRGRLVALIQIFFTIGAVMSSVIAGVFTTDKRNGWRFMLGLGCIPSLIQFLGFIYLPESPRGLVMRGKLKKAENVLTRMRDCPRCDVQHELFDIIRATEEDRQQHRPGGDFIFRKMLSTPHVRRAMFVGFGIHIFQQLCGINAVIYYSASILQMAGFPDDRAIWLTCVPNIVNLLCSLTGIYLVDKLGRRFLLVISMVGMMAACLVLAVGFQLQSIDTPSINDTLQTQNYPPTLRNDSCYRHRKCDNCITEECGFCFIEGQETITSGSCLPYGAEGDFRSSSFGQCSNTSKQAEFGVKWASDYCPTDSAWITIIGLAAYILCFAPGMGSLPWTINSEIYPLWARSTGNSLGAAINWSTCLAVSFTFLTILDVATKHGAFYMFAGICLAGSIFFSLFVPETRNKSLEDIEELLMMKHKKRKHGGVIKELEVEKLNCPQQEMETL